MTNSKKTPAKPAAGTAVAVKKASSMSLVSIKELLAQQVAALAGKTQAATGNAIRMTQDKQFKLPDGTTTPGPLQVVIVDFASVNKFYPGAYDPNNMTPPACFAIDVSPLNMVPSANSPENQNPSGCNSCTMNQWGSSGKGKACKNTRVLAVLPPDAGPDSPMWMLTTSPTANKAYDAYVNGIVRTFGVPPIGVVTEISMDPTVTYASVRFGNPVVNENLEDHIGRLQEAKDLLMAEPDVSSYVIPVEVPRGRAAARPAPVAAKRPAMVRR